jgi:hypothetical protein
MGVVFNDSNDSPDTLRLGNVTEFLNQLDAAVYDPASYKLYGSLLPDSAFLHTLQEKLSINSRSIGAIDQALDIHAQNLSMADLMYHLKNQLIAELLEINVFEGGKQLNILRLNVLALICLIMKQGSAGRIEDLDVRTLLNDLVSRAFHKDEQLFQWIEKFFGVYTPVGLIIKQVQIFETQETPRIKFDRET